MMSGQALARNWVGWPISVGSKLAFGTNCGSGIEEIEQVTEKMRRVDPESVLIAKANAGIPRLENDVPVFKAAPEMMGCYAARIYEQGAAIISASCGSTLTIFVRLPEP